jgi:hypothetical protein
MRFVRHTAETVLAGLLLSSGVGCSNGGGGDPNPPTLYNHCGTEGSVGNLNLMVFPQTDTTTGGTRFQAEVATGPVPDVFQVLATQNTCLLREEPAVTCTPACPGGSTCVPGNQCDPEPNWVSVGTVTLGGLGAPVEIDPMGTSLMTSYDQILSNVPYPPAAQGALITLQTAGGDYAPFALMGRGIPPLQLTVPDFVVTRGQPLTVTWTTPDQPGAARIQIDLAIGPSAAPHGQIKCNFPDSGEAQIPASLINQLFDLGVGDSAELDVARVTIDARIIEPGCVEFWVSSPVTVSGTISGG